MIKSVFCCFIIFMCCYCTSERLYNFGDQFYLPHPARASGKIWALLVAGSEGWSEYRHQADVYRAFQILKKNGISEDHIIVMATDDIAHHSSNPTPGKVINYPNGPDVYDGVPKDYTHENVTAENFLDILSGNKLAMKSIGSGKVIESGPDDVIFVNFVGHGTHGVLMFPNDQLFADEFIDVIKDMREKKKFYKMVMYIEACYAGSLFDNMLPYNMGVLVVTSADPRETSAACFKNDRLNTWLSDVFSTLWMNHTQLEGATDKTIHHQYERVRSYTNTSHPQEYGDLDVGSTKLNQILGPRKHDSRAMVAPSPFPTDVVNSMEIPLLMILNQRNLTTDVLQRKILKLKYQNIVRERKFVDALFNQIVRRVSDNNFERNEELMTALSSLNPSTFKCYKVLYKTFSTFCMSPVQNPYTRIHFQKLVNMCASDWLSQVKAQEDIISVCSEKFGPIKPEHIY